MLQNMPFFVCRKRILSEGQRSKEGIKIGGAKENLTKGTNVSYNGEDVSTA